MQAPVIISIIPNELDKLATITPRTRPLANLLSNMPKGSSKVATLN